MKKKIISLFLSVVMVLTMVPTYSFMAYADDTASGDTAISSGIDNIDGDDEEEPTTPDVPECEHIFSQEAYDMLPEEFLDKHPELQPGDSSCITIALNVGCTEPGYRVGGTENSGYCVLCGKLLLNGEEITEEEARTNPETAIPEIGHSYKDALNEDGKVDVSDFESSYDEDGNLVVSKDGVTVQEYLDKLGNVDEYPTCSAEGSLNCKNNNWYLDSVYNETTGLYEANYRKVPCNEDPAVTTYKHLEVTDEAVEPDCENTGLTEGSHCDVCDAVIVAQEEIPALGHIEGEPRNEYLTEPTCTEPGAYHMVTRCTRCDAVLKDVAVSRDEYPALGHDFVKENGKFVPTKEANPPTCTEDGNKEYYTCTRCGELFLTPDKSPNAQPVTEDDVFLSRLGHDYIETVVTYAEGTEDYCTKNDTITYTCSRCGDTYTEITRVATGHDEADVVIENEVITPENATCGDIVTYDWDEVVYCTKCHKELSRESKHTEDAPLQHIPGEAEVEYNSDEYPYIDSTCTEEGSYWLVTRCERCGEIVNTEKRILPAKGHDYDADDDGEDDYVITTEPKCTEKGVATATCQVCGHKDTKEVAELGHNPGEEHVEYNDDNYPYIQPTCTEKGSYWNVINCTRCGAVLNAVKVILPELGHDYVATYVTYEEGTEDYCTKNDTVTYTCSRCGDTYTEITREATGHDYDVDGDGEDDFVVTTEPTCTEKGVETATCQKCGHQETREIAPLGHDVHVDQNESDKYAPTCTEEGYVFYICTRCGELIRKEVVPALGHDFTGNYDSLANCQHGDQYTCHRTQYVLEDETDENGIRARVVDEDGNFIEDGECGAFIEEGEKNTELKFADEYKNVVVPPTEAKQVHLPTIAIPKNADVYLARGEFDPDALVDYSVVDGKLVTGHAEATFNGTDYDVNGFYTYEFHEATCEFDAYYVYTCSCCEGSEENGVFVVELLNTAIGHRWALRDDLTNRDPSCTEDGTRYWYCLNDNGHQYTEKIPATGHNYQLVDSIAATCTESGYNLYKCFNTAEDTDPDSTHGDICGAEYKEYTTPALGHDFAEDVTQYVAPTCNTEGKRVYVCKRTGCTETYTVVIPKTDNHTYTLVSTTPATCTAEGTATYRCQDPGCDAQYTINTTPRTGHQYVENKEMFVAPTCVSQGYRYFECVNENNGFKCESNYTVVLPKVSHTPVSANNAVEATCTRAGKKADTICSVCGVVIASGDVIPATGHNYGKVDVVNPTCTDTGYTMHYCTNAGCNDMYIDTYRAKTPHTLEVVNTVAATCGEDGFVEYRCTNCDHTETKVLPATGNHRYSSRVTVQPTCKTKGEMKYTCSVCGYEYIEEIPMLKHSPVSAGNAVAPTCTNTGKGSDTVCSECGVTLATGSIIPATGHNYSKIDVVNPTCTDKGHTVHTCTNPGCDDSYIDDYTAVIDHVMEKTETVPATCTEAGYIAYKCNNCDYTTKEILPATGHDWIVKSVKPATCCEEGETTYECSACGETRTDDRTPVDNTAHNYVVTDTKEATCTSEGYDVYTCMNVMGYDVELDENGEVVKKTPIYCGDTYKVTTTPKTAHSYKRIKYTAPTCVANGYWTNECTVCKDVTIVEDDLTATGHSWVDTYVKASTSKDGSKTTACALCGTSTTERIARVAKVQLSATKFTYTGKQIKPVVTVTDVDGNVVANSNYTVTYTNNKKIGKATVTVTFKGNKYEGVVKKTFTIIPKKAGISNIHSGKKSIKFTWGRVGNCNGYQIQYSTSKTFKSAKSKYVKSNKTVTKNITGLKSGKKYYIRIRAYKIVDGKKIYGEWNATKKARIAK